MTLFRTALRRRLPALVFVLLLCFAAMPNARAADENPLDVPDLSSPRAAMAGFLALTDSMYTQAAVLLNDYFVSNALYLNPEHRQLMQIAQQGAVKATRILDLSSLPPILKSTLAVERVEQFREILDRIPVPPLDQIPDAAEMASHSATRWRLPGTDITFVRVETGPRTGEYVLSAETVEQLPDFYQRVKDLPYKPGTGRDLAAAFQKIAPRTNATLYERFSASMVGLGYIFPMRWMLTWPDWTRIRLGGAVGWQWTGLAIGATLIVLLLQVCRWISLRLRRMKSESNRVHWDMLPIPIGLLISAGLLSPTVCTLLHLGGTPMIVIATIETLTIYIGSAWLALIGCTIIAELIVGVEHATIRSLDGQLIRLGSRLVGAVIAVACLIKGADDLGFPIYSVIAGLGIGGLAVALGAKDSIANLLGSMLIMFEKPFRVGHHIRVGAYEGTVEDVGFRSTRIRTPDNSLISVPNDAVINATVDNLSMRTKRRQHLNIGVGYNTPRATLEAFIAGIIGLIEAHDLTEKGTELVSMHNLGDSSLDILVLFQLIVEDDRTELSGRHEILMKILALAEEMGISVQGSKGRSP